MKEIQYDDCFLFRAHQRLLVRRARCYLSVSDSSILHAQRLGAVLMRGCGAGLSWDCEVTGDHQHQEDRDHQHGGCHHSLITQDHKVILSNLCSHLTARADRHWLLRSRLSPCCECQPRPPTAAAPVTSRRFIAENILFLYNLNNLSLK